ncbi:MAG: cytochrome c-type biogenesis protein CcmH [Gammaproteobacteria bacterium]|nr:cytochrome c-type biogenesis protein CcmH [Gammaproteobacteria bacterium]
MRRLWLWLMLLLLLPVVGWAAIDTYSFDDPAQEKLYRELILELRCPKCQNNSIHDSDAELSQDLRQLVYQQVKAGASREQVVAFLVERYGPFIHYQPPASAALMILLPVGLFLLAAVGWLLWWLRRPADAVDEEQP